MTTILVLYGFIAFILFVAFMKSKRQEKQQREIERQQEEQLRAEEEEKLKIRQTEEREKERKEKEREKILESIGLPLVDSYLSVLEAKAKREFDYEKERLEKLKEIESFVQNYDYIGDIKYILLERQKVLSRPEIIDRLRDKVLRQICKILEDHPFLYMNEYIGKAMDKMSFEITKIIKESGLFKKILDDFYLSCVYTAAVDEKILSFYRKPYYDEDEDTGCCEWSDRISIAFSEVRREKA